ncbi:MAG: hypothetical protein Tsb0014_15050 [Pleurocapsa sp.]
MQILPASFPIAQASDITPQTVAQQITVRVASNANHGSGVLIERSRQNYYVLTNTHVVNRASAYKIFTADGIQHSVKQRWLIPGVDLALLLFTSDRNYATATINNAPITAGESLYVSGYPQSGGTLRQPIFVTTPGQLTETTAQLPLGYSLSYSNLVRAGMSGGGIFDAAGRLIGINGMVRLADNSDRAIASGIPIDLYLRWKETQPNLPDTTPNPQNITATNNLADSSYNLNQTLSLKTGAVQTLAFNAVDRTIISGSDDGTITLWQGNTIQQQYSWQGHQTAISAIAISPDGKFLATGDEKGTIKIWDLLDKKLLFTLSEHTDTISSLIFSPDGRTLISSSWDRTIRLWETATGKIGKTLAGHSQLVNAIAITPNGEILATGSQDKTIRLWHLPTGKLITVLKGHSLGVLSLAISGDGKTLVSGSADGMIKTWNLATKELIKTWQGHNDGIWSIAIASDNQTLFTSSWDKTIKVWDLNTSQQQSAIAGYQDAIFNLILTPDNQTLLGRSWQGNIYFWQK